jgi:acetyl esterase
VTLHPQATAFLADVHASGDRMPWEFDSAAEGRAAMAEAFVPPAPRPVGAVSDRTVPGPAGAVPVRVYAPAGDGPWPALVWFHGGGWVVGSLAETDDTCRALCAESGAVVISVDYRLAPEHKFPAAWEDCVAVTRWVAARGAELGVDGTRIAVGGDSAGGNLAAVVAQVLRDEGGPAIAFQLLVYPVCGTPADGRDSYREFAEGHYLTREAMDWFTGHYANGSADLADPRLAPLLAPDLAGLPPALVILAACDPLADEGTAYAARLRDAGIPVTLRRFEGQIHAFFSHPEEFDAAAEARTEAAAALRAALAAPTPLTPA